MMLIILLFIMADFFVSLKVGIEIGYLNSVIWILGSMFAGIILLRLSPYALIATFQSFSFGQIGARDVQNASMAYLFGSILLIIPGVLSDMLGVGLLLYSLYLHLFAKMQPKQDINFQQNKGDDNVIDVEIIDECSSSDRLSRR